MSQVLIPLADGCEELEAVTLIDLLRRAEIEVTVASLKKGLVHCSRGLKVQADCTLEEVMDKPFDMIVLSGGLPRFALILIEHLLGKQKRNAVEQDLQR